MTDKRISKKAKALLLALASFLCTLGLYLGGVLGGFELKAYDFFSRHLNPPAANGEVVIVEIDQASVDALNELGIGWPWPRQVYAPLVDYLSGATVIFIDMIFSESSTYGVEDDELFAAVIRKGDNVFLPLFLSAGVRQLTAADLDFLAANQVAGEIGVFAAYDYAVTPIAELQAVVKGGGNVMVRPDADGIYRQVPLLFGFRGQVVPNFILAYFFKQNRATLREGQLLLDGVSVPLAGEQLYLRFYRRPQPFPVVSASAILAAYQAEQEGGVPAIPRDYFVGKKILVGPTAAGLYDLKPTAVASVSSGVMIQATLLDNLLSKDFIRPAHPVATWLLIMVPGLLICIYVMHQASVLRNLVLAVLLLGATLGVGAVFFQLGYYLPIIAPAVNLIGGFLLAASFSYATEGRERKFVRRTFSRYMDGKLVDHVLEHPELLRPGGRRCRVTVFFADIAGFTSMSERLPPEEVVEILRSALNAITEVIIRNGGVIDKYIGDAVMAFWGSPLADPTDEENACRAALQCLAELGQTNQRLRARGLSEIDIRIGINTGEAIVGNLGSDRIFDYTAIGDTVNLASRLEGANKVFRTRIIVAGETMAAAHGLLARSLGRLAVKGRAQPVEVFELLAEEEEGNEALRRRAQLFRQGRACFMARDWAGAAVGFEELLAAFPTDGPAAYYLDRCRALAHCPELTEEWDIIRLDSK